MSYCYLPIFTAVILTNLCQHTPILLKVINFTQVVFCERQYIFEGRAKVFNCEHPKGFDGLPS
jgi:hypothetical protein